MTVLRDDWRDGQRCPRIRGKPKRRAWKRSPSSVTRICVHATAVAGGFGLAPYQRQAAAMRLRKAGRLSLSLEEIDLEALRARYRETTYHGIYRQPDDENEGLSVVQWPITDYTYHGNGANGSSVGWAIDGLWSDQHRDPLDVDGARASLRHLADRAAEQGADLREITAHANHANKPHDPGALVWRAVVRPVAAELGLDIRPEWTTRGARPVIADWEAACS